MYAIVKTGGKQYKVAEGDKLNIEKLDAQVGETVALEAICIVDGDKIEADPAKAAKVEVIAEVLEQFKGEKAIVFKFKKRKNYKRKKGHRQLLTRVEIKSIGAAKKAAKKQEPAKEAVEEKTVEAADEAAE
ncbi:MAG: 50S ribosomal protein L21 [Eggerthellaceae bacterium]|nr:50S ribosomal protein L21 [Eggerthellaceae bacterium]